MSKQPDKIELDPQTKDLTRYLLGEYDIASYIGKGGADRWTRSAIG